MADTTTGGFLRDSSFNLDFNCKVGCSATTAAAPGYQVPISGPNGNTEAIDADGNQVWERAFEPRQERGLARRRY